MMGTFREDLKRWVIPGQIGADSALTTRTVLRLFWQHMPVRATALFRLACWFKKHQIPMMPGLIQRWIYRAHGLEIPSGADIGGGLYIAHPNGTVIMPRHMGRNCSVIANVTIGMRNEWAFPDIGDEVFIGAGARVLGGIKIGDRVVIGANAVVIQDAPEGATMVGIPARPVQKKQVIVQES
jgi:serine O-acetyltransferase